MLIRNGLVAALALSLLAACGQQQDEASVQPTDARDAAPALEINTLRNGYGREAQAGDSVTVHYTGWLYDENAEKNRGQKFDSSVDRGTKFQFVLGRGRVIKGWDQGIPGMVIGEKRQLTIPAHLAYGERGSGGVIPPGATLVFEVELFAAEPPGEGA